MRTLNQLLSAIRENRLADAEAWRSRLVVWLAAATVGLVIVIFARMTDTCIALFFSMQKAHWWLPLIVTPLGGIVVVGITRKWFFGAGGSGIPQTIAALHGGIGERQQQSILSLKLAVGKIVLGVSAIAAGFSAGREGPSVQVGASIMYAFRRFLPNGFALDPKQLILAGGAAGISATFNTPLAGVVFAIEELGRSFEHKTSGVLITAIVLSGIVAISMQGDYSYFGHITVEEVKPSIIWPILICGIICGVCGGLFSRILITSTEITTSPFDQFRKLHPLWWAGLCGLIVAGLGLMNGSGAHGSGYIFTREMLHGTVTETWQFAPTKFLATIFTYLSGVPGGIFAPSLSIGAGIGNDLIPLLGHQHVAAAIYALCMTGFLAAVTQTPITSFIIVMEMIDGHEMVLSLMTVALVSTIVARLFSPPLYTALADAQIKHLQQAPD
jgi:H+/Cl- antiporter ClcA